MCCFVVVTPALLKGIVLFPCHGHMLPRNPVYLTPLLRGRPQDRTQHSSILTPQMRTPLLEQDVILKPLLSSGYWNLTFIYYQIQINTNNF